VHNCVAPFTSHGKLRAFGAEKPISWAQPPHFDCFARNLLSGVTYGAPLEMLLGNNNQQEEPDY